MSEEKNVNETTKEEEAKKGPETIDADVKTDENGNQKAVEHEGLGKKVWNGLCAVGRTAKKAAPYVGTFALGVATTLGGAYFLGRKADEADFIDGQEQESLPEKDDSEQ